MFHTPQLVDRKVFWEITAPWWQNFDLFFYSIKQIPIPSACSTKNFRPLGAIAESVDKFKVGSFNYDHPVFKNTSNLLDN